MRNVYKKLALLTYVLLHNIGYNECYGADSPINSVIQSSIGTPSASLLNSEPGPVPLFSVVSTDKQALSHLTVNKSIAILDFCADLLDLCADIENRRFSTYRNMYETIAQLIETNGGMPVVTQFINNPSVPQVLRCIPARLNVNNYTNNTYSKEIKQNEKLQDELLSLLNNDNCLVDSDCKISTNKSNPGILVDVNDADNESDAVEKIYLQRIDWELHNLKVASSVYSDLEHKWEVITENIGRCSNHKSLLTSPKSINISEQTKVYISVVIAENQSGLELVQQNFCPWMNLEKWPAVDLFITDFNKNFKRLSAVLNHIEWESFLKTVADSCYYLTQKPIERRLSTEQTLSKEVTQFS